ncbi:MAG: Bax inhibitor-1/YccA family protein [Methylococcales bacterium]|jgi:modulator of FtsH protease|nr:Bax inhibitor-1/YccA family protein [Methylococcales bacterium]MBT7409573.1 Bax inhibitor-1/YccA family protein [Methylococcales bacterium]
MNQETQTLQRTEESILQTNKLIKNTYILLSMTLTFSAVMALISVQSHAAPIHWLLQIGGMIGLLVLVNVLKNSIWGIAAVFAFTGFLGWTLGPMLNFALQMSNGGDLIMFAMGTTGIIFFALSGYALTTRKDFSFMSGFLMVGMILVIVAMIANIFLEIPALHLAISSVMVLLMSGYILYDTSQMVHDDGTGNYILMTVNMYLNIYLLFVHLLNLFMAFGDD